MSIADSSSGFVSATDLSDTTQEELELDLSDWDNETVFSELDLED